MPAHGCFICSCDCLQGLLLDPLRPLFIIVFASDFLSCLQVEHRLAARPHAAGRRPQPPAQHRYTL